MIKSDIYAMINSSKHHIIFKIIPFQFYSHSNIHTRSAHTKHKHLSMTTRTENSCLLIFFVNSCIVYRSNSSIICTFVQATSCLSLRMYVWLSLLFLFCSLSLSIHWKPLFCVEFSVFVCFFFRFCLFQS